MVKTAKKTTKVVATKKTTKPAATKKRAAATPAKAKTRAKATRPVVRESRTKDFMVIQFTRDTLYWLILGVVAVIFVMWVTSLQYQINDLYDQIEASERSSQVNEEKLRYYQLQSNDKAN